MASPRLDHRLPGAVTVFLLISRRTILLSANAKLEQGQGALLWEGAERSRPPEGALEERAARQTVTNMAVGKATLLLPHSSALPFAPKCPKKYWLSPPWLSLVQFQTPGCECKVAIPGSQPCTVAMEEGGGEPGEGGSPVVKGTSQSLGRSGTGVSSRAFGPFQLKQAHPHPGTRGVAIQ